MRINKHNSYQLGYFESCDKTSLLRFITIIRWIYECLFFLYLRWLDILSPYKDE